jgi:predicted nucleic acid-binding protein
VTDFVLDNSVTMRWFFESAAHPYADSVLRRIAAGDNAVVPALWFYEASNVLAREQNKGTSSAPKVDAFLGVLKALNINLDVQSVGRVLADVHRLAVAYRLTSYDAAYLEVALRLQIPLATLDQELIAACGLAGVTVL